MDGTEWSEEYDEDFYPATESTAQPAAESRLPDELLQARPSPAPILIILLIVFWLWVPFIASVVLLVVLLGIFATVEDPRQLNSLQGSLFTGLTSAGGSLGLTKLSSLLATSSALWDVSNIVKLWNRLLDSSPALQGVTRDVVAVAATQVDWIETGDAHILRADMPGVKKEDVMVELEGDRILQISGQTRKGEDEGSDPQDTWHRVERSHGRFLRRFELPVNSKVDEVQAKVENGVLTVTIPKLKIQPAPNRAVKIH